MERWNATIFTINKYILIERKHNYFYKIVNLINGKYYYGIHSTNNLEDGYLGSGLAIKGAIKKYGKENFTKEIIVDYPTRKEASDYEQKIITLNVINLQDCYNIRTGGDNEYTHSEQTRKKWSETRKGKNCGESHHMYGKSLSETTKLKIKESKKNISEKTRENIRLSRLGRKHTEETLLKIKISNSGESNGFYGRNHTEESKIKVALNNPNRKPCEILSIIYASAEEASRQLNIPTSTIKLRIKSSTEKWSEWKFYN